MLKAARNHRHNRLGESIKPKTNPVARQTHNGMRNGRRLCEQPPLPSSTVTWLLADSSCARGVLSFGWDILKLGNSHSVETCEWQSESVLGSPLC
ncbi:unnamed protein product [Ixodes pacificus]